MTYYYEVNLRYCCSIKDSIRAAMEDLKMIRMSSDLDSEIDDYQLKKTRHRRQKKAVEPDSEDQDNEVNKRKKTKMTEELEKPEGFKSLLNCSGIGICNLSSKPFI